MGTKLQPGAFDCYRAALPDEPMFILLARDSSAPTMLRAWSDQRRKDILAGNRDVSDLSKCTEADQCADEMIAWRKRNDGAWRVGADRRAGRRDPTEEHLVAVAEGVCRSVGALLGIPSQFISSALRVVEQRERAWASPHFNGSHHMLRIEAAPGRFDDVWDREPDIAEMTAVGQVFADVQVLDRTPNSMLLSVLTICEEH